MDIVKEMEAFFAKLGIQCEAARDRATEDIGSFTATLSPTMEMKMRSCEAQYISKMGV